MATRHAVVLGLVMMVSSACAQTTEPAPTAPAVLDPLADQTLRMLQERKGTLKDFQATILYNVHHARTDDDEGKTGTVDFVEDPKDGPMFSVHFTHDTADGAPVKRHEQDLVFDGRNVTMIDRRGLTYHREGILPAGAKPGDAVALNGPMPLPIGMKAEEVEANFDVTVMPPEKGGNQSVDVMVLKLVPKGEVKGNFDFKELALTVDQKQQLPVKMVRTDRKGEITTVEFKDVVINGGKAKMIDTTVPKGDGWDVSIK